MVSSRGVIALFVAVATLTTAAWHVWIVSRHHIDVSQHGGAARQHQPLNMDSSTLRKSDSAEPPPQPTTHAADAVGVPQPLVTSGSELIGQEVQVSGAVGVRVPGGVPLTPPRKAAPVSPEQRQGGKGNERETPIRAQTAPPSKAPTYPPTRLPSRPPTGSPLATPLVQAAAVCPHAVAN